MRGAVRDWMLELGISQYDIPKALEIIKKTDLFLKEIPAAGLEYFYRTAEKKGTLNFIKHGDKYPAGPRSKVSYNVYANGQIRTLSGAFGDEYMSPLKAPRPIASDDGVETLVNIYTNSMKEIIRKWKKSTHNINREKA